MKLSAICVVEKRKVGAEFLVTPTGLMASGWNGTPPGIDIAWETGNGFTTNLVVHACKNTIDKMTHSGLHTQNCILFTTIAHCWECAKTIAGIGIRDVRYRETRTDMSCLTLLTHNDIDVHPGCNQPHRNTYERSSLRHLRTSP